MVFLETVVLFLILRSHIVSTGAFPLKPHESHSLEIQSFSSSNEQMSWFPDEFHGRD